MKITRGMHKLTKLLEISFTTKPKISLELFGISKRTSNTLITGFNDVICGYSLSISDCGKNFLSVKNTGILWYNQVQLFRQLENQHSFWNRSTFLQASHTLKKFKRTFQWKFCKISDCRAFSPF